MHKVARSWFCAGNAIFHNGVFGVAIVGTWHNVSAKHLSACLDEMCFRFNNRTFYYLFRDTMLKLIDSPNLEYKHLTARVQDVA